MRAVLQRVSTASVSVDGELVGEIGAGWLVLLGVGQGDAAADTAYIAQKILNTRAFTDAAGKMNDSLFDRRGEVLLVSQFTLYADCRNGRRPGFAGAASPDLAQALYAELAAQLRAAGIQVATGRFQAHMQVSLVNDGPVTLLLDSRKAF